MNHQRESVHPDSEQIILFELAPDASVIEVRLESETVWLSQQQIAQLFQTTRSNITMHLQNIFQEGELDETAISKEFLQVRQEGTRAVRRNVNHYNLDAILSVGYRVRSKVATQFRIWATNRLRDYLVQGYTLNERRLEQLGNIVTILGRSADELVSGSADVLAEYLPSLTLLREYDEGEIDIVPSAMPGWELTIEEARASIQAIANQFPQDALLGGERGEALEGIVATIYQRFGGQELYPTAEEKAANLLYLVVKDHPLTDGNKRSAAALFVTFLERNGILRDASGIQRISNNALAAITLMVAMSDPKEKELLVSLIIRMIS